MLQDKYKKPFRWKQAVMLGTCFGALFVAGILFGQRYPVKGTVCIKQDVAPFFYFDMDDPYASPLLFEMCNGGILEVQPLQNLRPGILHDEAPYEPKQHQFDNDMMIEFQYDQPQVYSF